MFKLVGLINKNRALLILIGIVLAIVILRYLSIRFVPDVYYDEDIILRHIESIQNSGRDYYGNPMPLFSVVGAGLTTYAYIYPMIILSHLFGGPSPINMRIIQQTLTIGAAILLSFGIKNWFKSKKLFWTTLIVTLTLPWGFVQANRIWDPAFVAVYFSIFFFFFSYLMKNKKIKVARKGSISKIIKTTSIRGYIYSVLMVIFLVMLAIVYPPARIPAVFIWIYVIIWLYKAKRINYVMLIIMVIVSFLTALPLAINIFFTPGFNERASSLLVFQPDRSFLSSMWLWGRNTFSLISPDFLFITGDILYRHSLPIFGMLGTINLIPLIYLFTFKFKKGKSKLNCLLLLIIFTTCLSTGLTNDYAPHSLRSCLCFLPYSILIGEGWYYILRNKKPKIKIIWYFILALSFIIYFIFYCLIGMGVIQFNDLGLWTYYP